MYSLLIVFFLTAILTSFLCSLWEAVLLSITPSYAAVKLQEGGIVGHRLKSFKEDIDRPLAAILTLNTIAHTAGAIGVGDQAARIWADSNPWFTNFLIPLTMTLAILVLSELIPKTLGANYWRELAPFTTRSLAAIIKLLFPLVWFSQLITKLLKKDDVISAFSRTDFAAMADIGEQHGVFERHESEFIRNMLRFESVQVKDAMTPRTVVFAASVEQSIAELFETHGKKLRFSRIPLYEGGSRDHVIGYMLKDELLTRLVKGEKDTPVGDLNRKVVTVEEDCPITTLLRTFLDTREKIAIVIDQFGGMAGVITLEDVIETLLGVEIVDESDMAADMQLLARRYWEKRAKRSGLLPEHTPDTPPTKAVD